MLCDAIYLVPPSPPPSLLQSTIEDDLIKRGFQADHQVFSASLQQRFHVGCCIQCCESRHFCLQHLDFIKLIVSFDLLEFRKLHIGKSLIILVARSFTVALKTEQHLENFKKSTLTFVDLHAGSDMGRLLLTSKDHFVYMNSHFCILNVSWQYFSICRSTATIVDGYTQQ